MDLSDTGWSQVADCCENGNEHSSGLRCMELMFRWATFSFSTRIVIDV